MSAEPNTSYLPQAATKPVTVATALVMTYSRIRYQLDSTCKRMTPLVVRLDIHVEKHVGAEQMYGFLFAPIEAGDTVCVCCYMHLSDAYGKDISVSGRNELCSVTWEPAKKLLHACGLLHMQHMHGFAKIPRASVKGAAVRPTSWRALVRSVVSQYKRKGFLHRLILKNLDALLRGTDHVLVNS